MRKCRKKLVSLLQVTEPLQVFPPQDGLFKAAQPLLQIIANLGEHIKCKACLLNKFIETCDMLDPSFYMNFFSEPALHLRYYPKLQLFAIEVVQP